MARSTDDAEAIFAFLHGLLGPVFDEKDFHDAFPKNYNVIQTWPFITTLGQMTDTKTVHYNHSTYRLVLV